jgi:6-phosphogluconolactonase
MMQTGNAKVEWREEASADAVASRLATDIAGLLHAALANTGEALLAVSGGATPVRFFDKLSREDLDWEKVTIILADERCVPIESSRSNARLVALNLLQNKAAKARFEGLYEPAGTAEEVASLADERMRALPFPPDAIVLGMGTDGHVASLFPDWDRLEYGLNPATSDFVLPVHAPSAVEPRLTLPLARIAETPFIALLMEGEEKKQVLREILDGKRGAIVPVWEVIKNAQSPVRIYWSARATKN